jgi:hypothetical protein
LGQKGARVRVVKMGKWETGRIRLGQFIFDFELGGKTAREMKIIPRTSGGVRNNRRIWRED